MTRRRRPLWAALLLLAAGGWRWDVLTAEDPDIEAGNQAYRAGRFADALERYQASLRRGDDPRIHHDIGAAEYKLGVAAGDPGERERHLARSAEEFSRAAESADGRLKSSAYYDLGNAQYQRKRWDEAVDAYRRALRADPQNDQARHNLEMALRQRPKQPPQGGQGPQGQQQAPSPQQEPGQGGRPGQPGQEPQPQPQPQPDQGQQGQQGEQPGQPGQGTAQDPQAAPDRPQPPEQQGGQEQGTPDQESPPHDGEADGDDRPGSESQEQQKLDALEKRSRDLQRRLLRSGRRSRDPAHLDSEKDW
jgi:tetratricopeptide (TPR) repeat protein